jgi:hypothetical protein
MEKNDDRELVRKYLFALQQFTGTMIFSNEEFAYILKRKRGINYLYELDYI